MNNYFRSAGTGTNNADQCLNMIPYCLNHAKDVNNNIICEDCVTNYAEIPAGSKNFVLQDYATSHDK